MWYLELLKSLPDILKLIKSIIQAFNEAELRGKIKEISQAMDQAKESKTNDEIHEAAKRIAAIWANRE